MSSLHKKGADEQNVYGLQKLPPGQLYTDKFPVLSYGPEPDIASNDWRFRLFGLITPESILTWDEFMALPQTTLHADFHCVTHWSRFDDDWTGVMFNDLWHAIKDRVAPEATHVMQHAYGGYTTNLPLQVMLDEDVMFAHTFNGAPLERGHGGPMRTFTPKRYAWKGAKWVNGLEFLSKDRPGFWEQNGYHNEGDPWREERYW
jgi:DMSO/TMAO reductase YedYZ molybdopterin-dependent catalytic subunit